MAFVLLNNSVASGIFWYVICKATCGTYIRVVIGIGGCIFVRVFKHKFLVSEYFEEILGCAAMLVTEHIKKNNCWF